MTPSEKAEKGRYWKCIDRIIDLRIARRGLRFPEDNTLYDLTARRIVVLEAQAEELLESIRNNYDAKFEGIGE